MSTEITSVSVSGCYWSGSSAVIDILTEHSSCIVVPEEFSAYSYGQFFEEALYPISQGVYSESNLENNLGHFIEFNKNEPPILFAIIRRFCHLMSRYPKNLFYRRMGLGTTLGKKYYDSCETFINYLREIEKNLCPKSSDHLCGLINHILTEGSKGALHKFGRSMPEGKLLGVFDQFIAAPYLEFTLPYLPDTRFVNVDRDWRDQYVDMRPEMDRMMKVNNAIGARPWGEDITSKLPSKIEFFVQLREKVKLLKLKQDNNAQTIWLQFEDLVEDTDKEATKLFDFLGIDKVNWRSGNVFLPDRSRKNIGIWRNSPYRDEIEILEHRLSK